jgi:predicted transposase YbfD/YdcC
MLILDVLEDIADPRRCNAVHDLTDVLFVAFAAMLCGAVHCTEMALFAQARLELLRQFVPLRGGAPSHDTFSRVFAALDPEAFAEAFQRLMSAFGAQARDDLRGQVAIDGKSLRRAYHKGQAHMPPLVVTVFDCETFMSLSQAVAVAGKGGEAQAAIAALELMSLKGLTVTGDALHCHQRLTRTVRRGGGDYVLAVKGNQSKLAKEAAAALDKAQANPRTAIAETHDDSHDRDEVRRCFVTPFRQSPGQKNLVDLIALARVETWRTVGDKTTHKVRAYALSRRMTPAEVLRAVRGHWQIENNLHWQLDVLMAEDDTRNRKGGGPAVLAALRRMALNVLRAEPAKIPLTHKHLKARWNDSELMRLMTHVR